MGLEAVWYKMNDNAASTTVVDDANGNDGAAQQNTDQMTDTGKINTALRFIDGSSDYITVTDADALNVGSAISISVWINNDAYSGSNGIIGKNYNTKPYYGLWSQGYDIKWEIADADSFDNAIAGITLSIETWYHVIVTQTGTAVKIYINANEEVSDILTETIGDADNNNDLNIGRLGTAGYYWDGKMDDLRIFNFALSAAQRAALYNSGNGTEMALDKILLINVHDCGETSDIVVGG